MKSITFVIFGSGRRTSIELDATELQPYNQEDLRLGKRNHIFSIIFQTLSLKVEVGHLKMKTL